MRSIFHPGLNPGGAAARIACLPGAYHGPEDFVSAGFAAAVQERRLPLDLEFVDLEMQHLGDRSSLPSLRSDIVLPARRSGVAIWLAGISMGGCMALEYAAAYPHDLDGLCLLSPYLGNRLLIAEIEQAGGMALWKPGALAETDHERRIWRYIQGRASAPSLLYLGFGRQDRFVAAHRLLAGALPPESVHTIEGGHDWPTWMSLWENFLDSRFA
jgi:pimeloyl-ACP methyl ester carboxylesterase